MARGQLAGTLGVVAAELEMNIMNCELKPTPLPEDLRSALHVILERIRYFDYFDLKVDLQDDLLGNALEVVRCHLVGIAATEEYKDSKSEIRGEGWSL